MNEIITPAMIEKRLRELSREIDQAHQNMIDLELDYHQTKSKYELAVARSRITLSQKSSPSGKNYTVGEREDLALIENAELHERMGTVEALVKAARANTIRLKTQVEIARSVGTSVRTSMDLT
jgi:hypothetical protein